MDKMIGRVDEDIMIGKVDDTIEEEEKQPENFFLRMGKMGVALPYGVAATVGKGINAFSNLFGMDFLPAKWLVEAAEKLEENIVQEKAMRPSKILESLGPRMLAQYHYLTDDKEKEKYWIERINTTLGLKKPMTEEEFLKLSSSEQQKYIKQYEKVKREMAEIRDNSWMVKAMESRKKHIVDNSLSEKDGISFMGFVDRVLEYPEIAFGALSNIGLSLGAAIAGGFGLHETSKDLNLRAMVSNELFKTRNEPDFSHKLTSAISSFVTFFGGSYLSVGALSNIKMMSEGAKYATATAFMSAFEAAVQAENDWQRKYMETGDEVEATNTSRKSFIANLAVTGVTNKLLFDPKFKGLLKTPVAAIPQALQEGIQQDISSLTTDTEIKPEQSQEEMILGYLSAVIGKSSIDYMADRRNKAMEMQKIASDLKRKEDQIRKEAEQTEQDVKDVLIQQEKESDAIENLKKLMTKEKVYGNKTAEDIYNILQDDVYTTKQLLQTLEINAAIAKKIKKAGLISQIKKGEDKGKWKAVKPKNYEFDAAEKEIQKESVPGTQMEFRFDSDLQFSKGKPIKTNQLVFEFNKPQKEQIQKEQIQEEQIEETPITISDDMFISAAKSIDMASHELAALQAINKQTYDYLAKKKGIIDKEIELERLQQVEKTSNVLQQPILPTESKSIIGKVSDELIDKLESGDTNLIALTQTYLDKLNKVKFLQSAEDKVIINQLTEAINKGLKILSKDVPVQQEKKTGELKVSEAALRPKQNFESFQKKMKKEIELDKLEKVKKSSDVLQQPSDILFSKPKEESTLITNKFKNALFDKIASGDTKSIVFAQKYLDKLQQKGFSLSVEEKLLEEQLTKAIEKGLKIISKNVPVQQQKETSVIPYFKVKKDITKEKEAKMEKLKEHKRELAELKQKNLEKKQLEKEKREAKKIEKEAIKKQVVKEQPIKKQPIEKQSVKKQSIEKQIVKEQSVKKQQIKTNEINKNIETIQNKINMINNAIQKSDNLKRIKVLENHLERLEQQLEEQKLKNISKKTQEKIDVQQKDSQQIKTDNVVLKELLSEEIKKIDGFTLLETVVEKSPTTFLGKLFKVFYSNEKITSELYKIPVYIKYNPNENSGGFYDANKHHIVFSFNGRESLNLSEAIMAEEIGHALTARKLQANPAFKKTIETLMQKLKKDMKEESAELTHRLQNAEEFIAGIWTSSSFRQVLNKYTFEKSQNKSVFQKIKDLIKRVVFDFKPNTKQWTYLDEAFLKMDELLKMDMPDTGEGIFYSQKQKNADKQSIKSKNAAIYDALTRVGIDFYKKGYQDYESWSNQIREISDAIPKKMLEKSFVAVKNIFDANKTTLKAESVYGDPYKPVAWYKEKGSSVKKPFRLHKGNPRIPMTESLVNMLTKITGDIRIGIFETSPFAFKWIDKTFGTNFVDTLLIPSEAAHKNARITIVQRSNTIQDIIDENKLKLKNFENIMSYAIAQQKGGIEALEMTKQPIVKQLTKEEKILYDKMVEFLEYDFHAFNEARRIAGKASIDKVENYFTWQRIVLSKYAEGVDPVTVDISQFISAFETKMPHEKKRVSGASQPFELNAIKVFHDYQQSVQKYIYLSPVLARGREMLKFMESVGISTKAPRIFTYINDWINFEAGIKKTTILGSHALDQITNQLTKNLADSIMVGNLKVMTTQISSFDAVIAKVGISHFTKGMNMYLDEKMRDFVETESNVFSIRSPETAMIDHFRTIVTTYSKSGASIKQQSKDIYNAIKRYGYKHIQIVDAFTAKITWLSAYSYAKENNIENPALYADRILIDTQASAASIHLSRIQRTTLGRALSLFGTFMINRYSWLKHDIALPIVKGKHMDISRKEAFKTLIIYYLIAALTDFLFEEIIGINSPNPTPIKSAYISYDKHNSLVKALLVGGIEIFGNLPIISNVRYGGNLFGPVIGHTLDIGRWLSKETGFTYGYTPPFFELVAKTAGVPFTQQASTMIKGLEKDKPIHQVLLGGDKRNPGKIAELFE